MSMKEDELRKKIDTLCSVNMPIHPEHAIDKRNLTNALVQLITERDAERELEIQLGMIEYYDQVSNNEDMDWKGLLAENKSHLQDKLEAIKRKDGK